MILQNIDKDDSKVLLVEGRALVVGGGKNVRVKDNLKYNKNDFKKIIKTEKTRKYKIIIKGEQKKRGDLIKTTS